MDGVSEWGITQVQTGKLRYFPAQISLQPLHFPEEESIQSLQFHAGNNSHRAKFHIFLHSKFVLSTNILVSVIPFISSYPALPLPTGEVDSATIVPLPTSCSQHSKQVVGFSAFQRALSCIILLMMMII